MLRQVLSQKLELKMSQFMIQSMNVYSLSLPELQKKVFQKINKSSVILPVAEDYVLEKASSLHKKSLQSHILEQFEEFYLNQDDLTFLEEMISYLNDRGQFDDYGLITKALRKKFNCRTYKVDKMLAIIQSIEPSGIGARSVSESLELQINDYGLSDNLFKANLLALVKQHLADLQAGQLDKIKASLAVDEEDLDDLLYFIRSNLSPNPCHEFESEQKIVVTPSYEITESGTGQLSCSSLEKVPEIRLDPAIEKRLKNNSMSKDEQAFIKEEIAEAKALAQQIRDRKKLLDTVITSLVEEQYPLFKENPAFIKPLSQKELAEMLDLHPSTISRLLSNKYILTPQGTFPLKRFCARTYQYKLTFARLNQMVEAIIKTEQDQLSDQQICLRLKQNGVNVTRRTVNNHRNTLGYQSYQER
jgi:RNA polymerase sigma-54 factor